MQPTTHTLPGATERMTRVAVPGFLLLAVIALAFGLGYLVNDIRADEKPTQIVTAPGTGGSTPSSDDAVGASILSEIYQLLESKYVDSALINAEDFRQAAIDGVITSLNDPHTDYLSPDDLAAGALDLGSTYEGIGASVSDRTGQVTIVAPFRDSPAEAAGIRAGDIILEVEGESTEGWSDQQAVQVIRGPKGTPVTLKVLHTDGTTEVITVTRGDILIESVFTEPLLEVVPGESGTDLVDREGNLVTDIKYVYISQFHDRTLAELREALRDIESGGYSGLILDVRVNPGGLLSSTVDVADEFLDGGIILTEIDRDQETQEWTAGQGGVATAIPIVVIQDGGSASGAEVLAAALRDNNRATIVGVRSFGKGTVNQLQELHDCGDPEGCGALYLSVGRWYTPSGEQIEGIGVKPDIEVEMTGDDYIEHGDLQLYAAIDALRGN
jgi:carboxyl-terminal processing protease